MDRNRAVELATKLFASVLFALSLFGLVVAVQDGEGLASALFGTYLTGLLFVGVFRDAIDRRDWQLAFFAGVGVWGGYEYATNGDLLSLLMAALGVAMVAANLWAMR